MNINFKFFGSGIKKGFRAAKDLSFVERILFVSYIFVSFFLRMFLFTAPIVAVADVNIGKTIESNKTLTLGRIFSNTLRRNRYFELLMFYFIKDVILLGVLAVINLPTIFIFSFGASTYYFNNIIGFAIAIAVICGVISLLIYILVTLYFNPAAYVSSCGEKGYFSDIVHNSYNGVRYHVRYLLGIYIKYFFFALALILPTLGLAILLFAVGKTAGAIFGSIFIVVFLVVGYFLIPNIYSSFQTSKFMYYEAFVSKKHSYFAAKKENEDFEIEEEEEEEESDDEDVEEGEQAK